MKLKNFLFNPFSDNRYELHFKNNSGLPRTSELFLAIAVAVFLLGLLICAIRRCYRLRKLQATRSPIKSTQKPQSLAQEEIIQISGIKEELEKRQIKFLTTAQNEAPVQQERLQGIGVPLRDDEMSHLTQIEDMEQSDDIICPLCQQNFMDGEIKTVLPCQHVGHMACFQHG
ncbi:uncharacterized protein LOC129589829 [Paramacrobiotus metropolitanus]|uniref:uncharacterized protein LOC129589829 n=1 Tax=Paramacrobiotus metropolitanus TaxID=2943436 RepID=UPI002445B733|nr:uncharacterized protein LOC129589829 [Paramacrobiotus metropolitanus]